ncbi:unnamed protein product [Phyllotreta striolata]|uniref:Cytochrome P450 monooxygenase n=1 Tax=Phyllotreta striolata TaxID=444603 RepID=A0A9N9XRG2_PHYSR|nr:unnamed protein product [Phyllotreta striolata]
MIDSIYAHSTVFSNPSAKYKSIAFDYLLITAVSALLVWCVQFLWTRRRLYSFAKQVHGPPALPLIGSAWYFTGSAYDILANISSLFETYPGVFKVWFGPRLFFATAEPKHYEILMTKCLAKEELYNKAVMVVGKGLFTAEVPSWKKHRKLISPTFNQQILDSFVEVFSEQADVLVGNLEKHAGKGEFDVFHAISTCTLDIICETAMGVKVNAQTTDALYTQWTDRMMEIVLLRIFILWYHPDKLFNMLPIGREASRIVRNMHEFSGKVVREKKKAFEQKKRERENSLDSHHEEMPRKRKAFLDYMLEITDDENVAFSENELRQEVDTFVIAGSDTTASTNCYVLTMLGLHQDLQEKVLREILDVLGPDRKPEPGDLPKLKYLERFIKEALRLFPVAGFLARAIEEDIDVGNCIIPAGSSVVFGILRTHRNEKYWPDPCKFDPDRFLPEEVAKRHPCTYVPFSYGPRNCIGPKYAMMAMKSLLSTVLRKYKIFTTYKSVEDIKLKAHLVLRPRDGYKVYIERRNLQV